MVQTIDLNKWNPFGSIMPEHREYLQSRGVSLEFAKQAGAFSLPPDEISKIMTFCGWSDWGAVNSILVFPYRSSNGDEIPPRFRLFPPIKTKNGKSAKFLQVKGAGNHLYLPPGVDLKGDGLLHITEGEVKALAATEKGFPTIGLGGVWSFRKKGENGESKAISDLDLFKWDSREVCIVFDSDTATNIDVHQAEQALGEELTGRGAKVAIIRLPMGANGEKLGLDDYLAKFGPEAFAALPRTSFKVGRSKKLKEKKHKQQEQAKDFVSNCANNYDKSTIIKYLAMANGQKFYPQLYINVIRQYYKLIYCAEDFYEYQSGVYVRRELKTIETYIKELFGEKPRKNNIDEIVKLLAIDCHITIEALDNSKHNYLNLKNGLFDLANFKLIPHSPDYISIIQLPVNYDPKATCLLWKKTLRTSLPEDPALHDVLQEWAGYCITPDTKHEKAMIFDGEGANGKGVIGDTIAAMLGKDNCSAVHLADLERGAQRATLFGKLLNFASEISSKEIISDSYFKSIVSGDLITGEAKYKNPFTFRPFCKMMFATNNLPRVNDKSHGFYRKLIIIPFNQKFVDSNGQGPRKDKKRRAKLLKEIDGIFLWALKGLKRLEKRCFFTEPKVISGKIEEYRRQNNPIIQFVEECCELKEGQVEVKTAYKTYGEWALQFGFQTMNDVNFSKTLRKDYPQIVPDKIDGTRIFKGMILSKTGNGLLNMALRREEKRLAQRVGEGQ